MALLNIFRKGKKEGRQERKAIEKQKKAAEKQPKVLAAPKPKKIAELKAPESEKQTTGKPQPKKIRKGSAKTSYRILKTPQITEKAAFLREMDQYIFKVHNNATKPEIKKSVEEFYGVNVLNVRIINVPRKSKRLGRTKGWRGGYKKALVKIKAGQTIELFPH